jgi:hypothetical protein
MLEVVHGAKNTTSEKFPIAKAPETKISDKP